MLNVCLQTVQQGKIHIPQVVEKLFWTWTQIKLTVFKSVSTLESNVLNCKSFYFNYFILGGGGLGRDS